MPKKTPSGEEPSAAITKTLSVRCRYCGQKNAVKDGYNAGLPYSAYLVLFDGTGAGEVVADA